MCNELANLMKLKGKSIEDTAMNFFMEIDSQYRKVPIQIEKIITDNFGIPINESDFKDSEAILRKNVDNDFGIQGKVHINGENKVFIFYNPNTVLPGNKAEERIRFTLAHEIAHCILHAREINEAQVFVDFYRMSGVPDELAEDGKREIDANALAGAILMPKDVIIPLFYSKLEGVTQLQFIEFISNLFKVSKSTAKARLEYLNLI